MNPLASNILRRTVPTIAIVVLITAPVLAQPPAPFASPAATAAATPPASAAVPVPPAGEEDIRDIRGPISIPSPWRWLWTLIAVTAVLGLLYAAWRWWRLFAAVKAKHPHELALERLHQAKALMSEENARDYSFAVSEITRDYIEQRFGERAARRTTDEFLHDLVHEQQSQLAAHKSLLEEFLRYCDLAKFARWHLAVGEMNSMHESARAFITSTRPEPPEGSKRRHSKNGTAPHNDHGIVAAIAAGRHS